jgi:hypothetical protein
VPAIEADNLGNRGVFYLISRVNGGDKQKSLAWLDEVMYLLRK